MDRTLGAFKLRFNRTRQAVHAGVLQAKGKCMSISITPEEHRRQIQLYKKDLPRYTTYANVLSRILSKAFPFALVQARPKSVSSFAEKAVRKADKYTDAVHMLTDLCGARVIVQTVQQTLAVRSFIEANLLVIEFDDKSRSLHEDEFGYRDVHYIVQLREDRELGILNEEWEAIGDRKAELQVRTVLQHGWADILHDRIYKTSISVPQQWRREANRLSALLEEADDSFSQLADALDSQTSVYEVFLPKTKLEREAEVLKTILGLEADAQEDKQQKLIVALKLARVLMALDRFEEAIQTLNEYPQQTPEFRIHLGNALCRANRTRARGFKHGLKHLEAVALLGEPAETSDHYSPQANPERIPASSRAKALHRLGCILLLAEKNSAKICACLQKAHALRPDNPYYHLAYVQAEFCRNEDRNLLPMAARSLRNDIQAFRHHVTLGIELPNALFAIARCRLLLDETIPCLSGYARIIATILQEDSCVPAGLLDEEIGTVAGLCAVNALLCEQVLAVLHLARWRRFAGQKSAPGSLPASAQESLDWLQKRRKHTRRFKEPVLLVIGGAELMPRRKIQGYFSHMFEALEFFEGTVISGGTTSGVPGVLGDVTKTLAQQGSQRYELLSYLPKRLPSDGSVHPSYRIVGRTSGNKFSEQELIAYWTDLLLSGVDPKKVTAIGINGGRIADLEYRLALAFGARVGVMQDSGRAAAVLLADPDWNKHPALCMLPEDKFVVWAFVNRHNAPVLAQNEIAKLAPDVHEFYRQRRWEKAETSDLSLQPWNNLNPAFQNSNREQIAFIANVLVKCGFAVVPSEEPESIRFRPDEIEEMAEREHARWMAERFSEGWTYGKTRDLEKKTSPYLVPWSQVPAKVKEYDHEAVTTFPALLAKLGYEIRRRDEGSR